MGEVRDTLSEILRTGAQQMLSAAIESEVADHIEARNGIVDEAGCRLVVRNGSLPEGQVTTGLGPVSVRQPRVRDKRSKDQREVFTPGVLPKYLRKTKSIEDMIPWLYLKGISTNDFPEALQSVNPLSGGWPCSAVCWSAGFSLWDYRGRSLKAGLQRQTAARRGMGPLLQT